jgi:hypothetical protein
MFWRRKKEKITRGEYDKMAFYARLCRMAGAAIVMLHDGEYRTVAPSDLSAIKARLWKVLNAAGVMYTHHSFDCDDYARAAQVAAAAVAAERIPGASFCFCYAVVRLSDGRDHAVILAEMTSGEIVYLEPQWKLSPAKDVEKVLEVFA